MKNFVLSAASLLLLAMTAAACEGQGYPFSQRGTVTQNVAFTEIKVEYGRPVARGRALFGELVPWDKVWHPGADSATVISFSRDLLIEEQQVRAGEYSLWMIPRQSGNWTVILSRAAHVFHQPYPGDSLDAHRFDVAPERGAHMETMAIYFPVVLREDAIMRIHWGELIAPLRIKAPTRPPPQ